MVIGTDADPQNLEMQMERLQGAGAVVFRTATEAIDYVARRMRSPPVEAGVPVSLETLNAPFAAVNVGLEGFYTSLVEQGPEPFRWTGAPRRAAMKSWRGFSPG